MLGVIIQGAIRNTTVSVKMGVNGMPWAWERRGTPQSYTGCMREFPDSSLEGETDTFTERLLCAGTGPSIVVICLCGFCVCACLCRCVCKCL